MVATRPKLSKKQKSSLGRHSQTSLPVLSPIGGEIVSPPSSILISVLSYGSCFCCLPPVSDLMTSMAHQREIILQEIKLQLEF
jgi:hypothetical protein